MKVQALQEVSVKCAINNIPAVAQPATSYNLRHKVHLKLPITTRWAIRPLKGLSQIDVGLNSGSNIDVILHY